ncbi:ATP-dependent RNA helicase HrpA [Alteromonas sp. a30]|uniref:ATP-dependent RNA helicase HrpA n=1 Tax=Alteromonas sp. a30 TaxID=2730917 RepID=UPI00227FE97B|nr:ATP-dependent RNA helicase HrpA [Alteromonas sp. a30]MCY7296396.1 ATP-dependent RNA helicase HrpA [Alteromonas sp. a30]
MDLSRCLTQDRHRLRQMLRRLGPNSKAKNKQQQIEKLIQAYEASASQCAARSQSIPKIEYPELPVSDMKQELIELIQKNQVVIIAGETGSGKTTQLPKICLEAGQGVAGVIGHTQPRRLAARSVAARIAEELQVPLGQQVGFKVRFSDQSQSESLVKLMTDGILLAEIQEDRFLSKYDTLIIDEAHERSLNIDFILGYLKQLLSKRKDLKVIITSATIDPERFSEHFSDAPIVQVSGRTYPVEVRYRPLLQDDGEVVEQVQGILNAVHELDSEARGDILVFLSGEREIRDTAEFLKRAQLKHTEILPLYARLSASEQNKIFQGHSARRIVLATNVAETSLTVPGIRYVIDPGTARISRYSVRSKVQRLPIEPVSQASANQRAGRCGRLSDGICIRLYDEDDYLSRPEFTDPEILRTNLASVVLQMMALGLGDISQFPFVQAPDSRNVNDGIKLLQELQAIKKQQGQWRLTPHGRKMVRLPIDPRYARMVIAASEYDCLQEVMVIVSALSIQDPKERPREKQQQADAAHEEWKDKDSDFLAFVNLWNDVREQQKALSNNQFRKWCQQHFLNYLRVREWQDIFSQLRRSAAEMEMRLNSEIADYEKIHQSLIPGLLSHIGQLNQDKEYNGARNIKFAIFPGSGLSKRTPKWVMAAELVETSKLFARVVAVIQPTWLEKPGAHLSKAHYTEPYWSKKAGAAKALCSISLYGLPIVANRHVLYSDIDPVISRELFIREALIHGETKLDHGFLKHNHELVSDIEKMEDKARRKDILVEDEELEAFYDALLPKTICTEAGFKKYWRNLAKAEEKAWRFDPEALQKAGASNVGESQYPNFWSQGNISLPLDYQFNPGAKDDGVSLLIPLPVLNQVQDEGFDWLVPGLRHELIVTLIKSLPKQYRRNFVPAPDYANAVLNDISPQDGDFIAALTLKLFRMTGIEIDAEQWKVESLPDHLKFNFKVLDGDNKLIQQSRDLHELQTRLKDKFKAQIDTSSQDSIEKDDLNQWTIDDLPKQWTSKTAGFELVSYPALVKEGKKVNVRLFPNQDDAAQAHIQGVRSLIMKQLPSPISYLQDKLPNKAKLGLYFNPFGQVKMLIDDCIEAVIDDYLQTHDLDIREKAQFDSVVKTIAGELNELVLDVAKQVEGGLTDAHAISKKLKGKVTFDMVSAFNDLKSHLSSLVYQGFITDFGVSRLKDWRRYIQGLAKRLEKLPVDPTKDRSHQLNIEKVLSRYETLKKNQAKGRRNPELEEVRWMIEELRVSLYAQQLGTKMPISVKRIENYLEQL